MGSTLLNIGYGNLVAADRVIAILVPETAPMRRLVQEAKENGNIVDATCGRRTRAVIITDSRYIILSAVQPETIGNRFGRIEGVKAVEGGIGE